MHQSLENAAYGLSKQDLWERILGLIEQDLEECRSKRLFVEVAAKMAARSGESGSCEKEIGSSLQRSAEASTRS